ncbi:MAG TPA: hypothetical protein VJU87_07885 [Gemmatimonadaceae bacterium]|nr:hypothetical protein [Gemmatimonadaceae bacterium]
MGFEPNARRRLRLVCSTTMDPVLRQELALALEDEPMSQVPSVALAEEITRCPDCRQRGVGDRVEGKGGAVQRGSLCAAHRAMWNLELCTSSEDGGGDGERDREVMSASFLESLMRTALASEDGGTRFLSAYQRQARALQSVWEAHQRGAVHLPGPVAEQVERARASAPAFLGGSGAGLGSGARARPEMTH